MTEPGEVESLVTDPRLIEERRRQILTAATKLFSQQGFHRTTIQAIAKEAGVSTGLIYQYFHDKDDVLFLTLVTVLDTYEREIPKAIEGLEDPLERLCRAFYAYCRVVDRLLDATVLAYRSTKSLKSHRQDVIKERETATNKLLETCLEAAIAEGLIRPVNVFLAIYQLVHFCHAWALKQWALRGRYDLDSYVAEGIDLLIVPFLTETGRAGLARLRDRRVIPE
ncbi:MAG: TetR/AcrR family transcriptional regulator [Hyphomicrobiales bacterium]|nr:TetR/AcrR family transcriptional regulator [Hyphomicrobiales bacterium]